MTFNERTRRNVKSICLEFFYTGKCTFSRDSPPLTVTMRGSSNRAHNVRCRLRNGLASSGSVYLVKHENITRSTQCTLISETIPAGSEVFGQSLREPRRTRCCLSSATSRGNIKHDRFPGPMFVFAFPNPRTTTLSPSPEKRPLVFSRVHL